jgi:hypothetical protein
LKDGLRRGAESPTAQVRFQGTSSSGQIVVNNGVHMFDNLLLLPTGP